LESSSNGWFRLIILMTDCVCPLTGDLSDSSCFKIFYRHQIDHLSDNIQNSIRINRLLVCAQRYKFCQLIYARLFCMNDRNAEKPFHKTISYKIWWSWCTKVLCNLWSFNLLATFHHALFAEIGPSGSMDLNTFCSFYLVKNTKLLITWQPLKLKKKYTQICDPYNFSNLLIFDWPNLLKNQILHYKISYWQPSYLLGEISSL